MEKYIFRISMHINFHFFTRYRLGSNLEPENETLLCITFWFKMLSTIMFTHLAAQQCTFLSTTDVPEVWA